MKKRKGIMKKKRLGKGGTTNRSKTLGKNAKGARTCPAAGRKENTTGVDEIPHGRIHLYC